MSGGGQLKEEISFLDMAKELGAEAIIKKPFDHDQLIDLISSVLIYFNDNA